MKKLLLAAMTASMLMPSMVLASSIRPGSTGIPKARTIKTPLCKNESEKYKDKCDIVIDETGVTGPQGHITNVVQWTTSEQDFNVAGAVVGGAAGAGVGFAAGLGTCMFMGPFCLITAPAVMQTGMGVGGGLGAKGTGKFFTIVGDDAQGNRIIQDFKITTTKGVKEKSELLLRTTGLAEGETRK